MRKGFLSFLKDYSNDGALIWGGYFGKDIPADKLAVGVKVEKEHKDLYDKLKKRLAAQGVEMPITEQEFYETIAKAHFKEDDDYYDLLLKYVEKEKMSAGGKTDDFGDSEKSPIFALTKITREDVNQIITGARSVTRGDSIQAASNYLRGSESASSLGGSPYSFKGQEEERLREYISKNDLWIPLPNPANKFAEGGEAQVYLYGDHVIKLNDTPFYGSWEDYFNSLLLHNLFFPKTSYELIGFSEYKDYDGKILYAVVKQVFVKANAITNLSQVQKFMLGIGFSLAGNNHYRHPELGIEVKDLHEGNVLTRDDKLFFIDTIFYLKNLDTKLSGGGETGITPKYNMRDKVKLREPYDYLDENGNTITVATDDIGVIKYRDDNGREQEFSEWLKDIEEQNKIHGQIGYFVKFKKLPNYIWREESTIMPADDREILYKKVINLIKYEIEVTIKNIPTIRDWDTLETLHDVPYIHISGRKWNGYFRNYSSSATIAKIEEAFPKNKTLLRLANIYREYNMNDFNGGTVRQNEALKNKGDRWDYDGAVEYLKSIGLYEDRGYRYGSDWLYKPVPASVVEELKSLSEQLSKEFWMPKLAGGGETGEKTEFMYLAVSKNNSIRFDKPSYVLEYSAPNEHGLIKGKKLTYGYLTRSFSTGAPRGWFISEISMTQEEFNRSFDLQKGSIKIKFNDTSKLAGGGKADNLKTVLFSGLPRNYQIGIIIRAYEVNEDVEWSISDKINWLRDEKKIDILINDYKKHYPKRKFAYGMLPIKFVINKVMAGEVGEDYDSWEEYHKEYGHSAKHTQALFPILIDEDNDEYIDDGWHRFHRYYDLGLKEIPVVKYL